MEAHWGTWGDVEEQRGERRNAEEHWGTWGNVEVAVKGKAKRRRLSPDRCQDLGRRASGASALTHPHTFNPHQGLRPPPGLRPHRGGRHPRTTNHRPKPGSPAGQQSGVSWDTEDDEDEADDDDASLLAAESLLDSDIDDVSLLAAASVSDSEQEVDHLEGITGEMFEEDEQMEDGIHREPEEVEPLPDAHYGLLGSSRELLPPQGCMEELPEEVLRQILGLLPAQDLYRNISLVCHRWKNIVQDAKFVPYRKKYYRYMMMEKDAVLEVGSELRSGGVTDPLGSQLSVRRLVTLMAQHQVGERVRQSDVLDRVRKHRLFPQAEASIRLRIPNVPKCRGTEGPNPYACMAVVLILSENVADVQILVSLLSDCLSLTAVTEFLSHMAMMLLAVQRNNIQISNRLHYNIYYVLHLMENGPFSVSSGDKRRPQIQLTGEQQRILSHDIQRDHMVKIVAFAGTGKTTTLVKYTEQRPHLRFLYVAFNRSVAREAAQRFPANVACKTVHSLAFRDVGTQYRLKLAFNLSPFSVNAVLPEGHGGYIKAKVVTNTIKTFMASKDPTITIQHVPSSYRSCGLWTDILDHEKKMFVHDARSIWNKMKDLTAKEKQAYYITHDGYLKLWQLQTPKPCLSDHYDVLLIDEAQDCTPAIMDVLLSQRCGKILVGDPHQQIYTFRGAVNALQTVAHTHTYYLTQSFRFGAEIAYVGASILQVCKKVEKILVGGRQKGDVIDNAADEAVECVTMGASHCRGKTAILSRSNLSVFSEAVRLTDANPHCRINFIGDVRYIGLEKILDVWQLMQGTCRNPKFIKDPLVRSFAKKSNGFSALKAYVAQTDDHEMEAKLCIVEKYTSRIPDLVKRLYMCADDNPHTADFILGTVHKAKGLEFHTVIITDDFVKVPAPRHKLHHTPDFSFARIPADEWNLLYVAATRARTSLVITSNIRRLLTVAGEYFLKSEMPSSPLKVGETPPCSISDCPNRITPGSAFIMHRRQTRRIDGSSDGGALCERCVWTRIGPAAFLMTDDVHSMAAIPERLGDPVGHHVILRLI